MPDALDLMGEIASAIDGAALRGATLALAYVRDDLSPAVSFGCRSPGGSHAAWGMAPLA
jgi:hypothetical protein